jgi:hypothetical protein
MQAGRMAVQFAIVAALLSAAIGATWYVARQDIRSCVIDEALQPIAALTEENRKILETLKSEGLADSEGALLGSYLARIRKDGVPVNSGMKQRIDTLVNNNTVIVALLSKYAPHAKTPAFRAAAEQYRNYAFSFRDRWQSLFEVFMAGGNLPALGPAFPSGFSASLNQEMAAG